MLVLVARVGLGFNIQQCWWRIAADVLEDIQVTVRSADSIERSIHDSFPFVSRWGRGWGKGFTIWRQKKFVLSGKFSSSSPILLRLLYFRQGGRLLE